MKKIISFDLDMTLLDHKTYKIPDSAVLALKKLKENGHIIAIATGRDLDTSSSSYLIKDLDIDARMDLNGTKVLYKGELIYSHFMDKSLQKRLLDYGMEKGYCFGLALGDYEYYINSQVLDDTDKRMFGKTFRKYGESKELYDMNIRTLAYVGDSKNVANIERDFKELKLCLFSGNHGADVIEKTQSKAKGLRILADYLGIDMKDTIAFGDSMNDYEIVKEAGIGIAMGNAIDELKEVADYVTTDIDKDGIYNAVKKLNLI